MEKYQVADYYDTLFIYKENQKHLVFQNKICLSQKKVAFISQSKTNINQMLQTNKLVTIRDSNQNSIPTSFLDKISTMKGKYSRDKNCYQQFNTLINKIKTLPVSLDIFQQILILNEQEVYIKQTNKKIYLRRIVMLSSLNQQKLKYTPQNLQLFFNIECLKPLIFKNQCKKVFLKFRTIQQVVWMLLILQNLSLFDRQRQFFICRQNNLLETHPLLFQGLKQRFGIKEISHQCSKNIQLSVDSLDLLMKKSEQFEVYNSHIQNQNEIQTKFFSKENFIFQPLLNYAYFNLQSEYKNYRNQGIAKQFWFKYHIIGQRYEQNCRIIFYISKQQQVYGFSGIGKKITYFVNSLKIMLRKRYKFQQVIKVFNQQLSLDDLVEIYEISTTSQYPRL